MAEENQKNTNNNDSNQSGNNQQKSTKANQSQNQNKVKKGSKVSIKAFMIGCLFFGIVLVGIVYGALYFAIQSPRVLENVGLGVETVKSLLMVFTVLFFGLIFIISFSVVVLNGYRLISAKAGKLKYILGTSFGVVFLFLSVILGTISILSIRGIDDKQYVKGEGLVSPYIITKDNIDGTYLGDFDSPILAPVYFRFALNKEQFNSNIMPQINGGSLQSLKLNCGNGNSLTASSSLLTQNTPYFKGRCLFLEKKEYKLSLDYTYRSANTNDSITETVSLGSVNIDSKVDINGGNFRMNDAETSIVLGNAPTSISVDASTVFTDFLNEKNLSWDFNGSTIEGSSNDWDKENTLTTEFTYKKAGTYNVFLNLPSYETSYYLGEIKVLERNVPICNLNINEKGGSRYFVEAAFKRNADISNYNFKIIDNVTKETIDTIERDVGTLTYNFEESGTYKVDLSFVTSDGKNGSCSSDIIDISSGNYKVLYDSYIKGPADDNFNEVNQTGNSILIERLPSDVRLKVNKVIPSSEKIDVKLLDDKGEEVLSSSTDTYKFEISEDGKKNYKFILKGSNGLEREQIINIDVDQKKLIPRLKLNKNTGESPLNVKLDASSSELIKEDDEITFFSWDFGDGEKINKSSQGKVTHTYKFDNEKDKGTYYPKVTVETKDGLEDTAKAKVIVKRKQRKVDIKMPSNPTQVTRIGDSTNFVLDADGSIASVKWDFGNGKSISGEGRRYMDVNTTYEESGTYTVNVKVKYDDYPTVYESIKVEVK